MNSISSTLYRPPLGVGSKRQRSSNDRYDEHRNGPNRHSRSRQQSPSKRFRSGDYSYYGPNQISDDNSDTDSLDYSYYGPNLTLAVYSPSSTSNDNSDTDNLDYSYYGPNQTSDDNNYNNYNNNNNNNNRNSGGGGGGPAINNNNNNNNNNLQRSNISVSPNVMSLKWYEIISSGGGPAINNNNNRDPDTLRFPNYKSKPSMRDRVRVSNNSMAVTTTTTTRTRTNSLSNILSPSQKYFTLSPTAITHLQNPALYKKIVDEMIKHLRYDDYLTHPSSYPNTPTSASSEVLFKSIINNPMHQEFITMINSVKKDGNMIYIGFTGQNNVDDEAYQFLYRRHCSDKYGNTGLTLLTDTKNPLTTSIREKYTAKVYVIHSTFSKQAATHLELWIQQNFQSIIPGHLLNRGTSTISYQHASVKYKVSSKVYRVYVTVLEGVRHDIDKGLVTINYWKMSDTSTTNQLDGVESTREENKRLKEQIKKLEEEHRILKQNIGYRIPMRVRTDTNSSLISILVEKKRIRHTYPANRAQRSIRHTYPANRAQGVRRSTSPTKRDHQWQSRYHELKEYNTLNKHTNVPSDYTRNPQLGRWVNTQRNHYKLWLHKGKSNSMTPERINLLDAIGFRWRMKREIIPIDVDTSTTDDGTSTTTNNSNDDDGDRKPAAVW